MSRARKKPKTESRSNPLENPNIPIGTALDMVIGPTSSAGNVVTPWTIAGIPDVWRSINLIANKLAILDLMAFKDKGEGGYEPFKQHPAYQLLKRSPNEDTTPFAFKKVMHTLALVWGCAYAYVFRDEFGDPEELMILDPSATHAYREGGKLGYITILNGQTVKILAENVLKIMSGLSYDGISGMNITYQLKDSLGLSQAIQTYQAVYFQNNGMPSVVIELPPEMSSKEKVEQFRQTWGNIHVGLGNSHRPALMTNGAKLAAQINKDNVAGQVSELSEQQTRAIAKIFGIPASYYGLKDSYTSFNSLEAHSKQFLADTMEPHLTMWEQACEKTLLRTREFKTESVFIQFDRSKLIELDAKVTEEIWNQRLNNNQISWEEWRDHNNMTNNRKGTFFRAANINVVDENFEVVTPEPPQVEAQEQVQSDSPGESPNEPQAEPKTEPAKADERLIKMTEKTVNKLIKRIKKAVESHASKGDLASWDMEAEQRYFWGEDLGMFADADQAIQNFFQELKYEVNAISTQDVNKIRWEKYKQLVVKNLAGWGV